MHRNPLPYVPVVEDVMFNLIQERSVLIHEVYWYNIIIYYLLYYDTFVIIIITRAL